MDYDNLASPVLGATAAVAIGAAYILYRQSQEGSSSKRSSPPVKELAGRVHVGDVQATEERKRDFFRFYKSESIYLKSRGGEVLPFRIKEQASADLVLRELVKLLPRGTDIDALVYALSTSLGMDVLINLGVRPPFISQPVLVVCTSTGEVELVGFVGKDIRGERPDTKFTDWLIKVCMKTASEAVSIKEAVYYEVRPSGGNQKSSDFI